MKKHRTLSWKSKGNSSTAQQLKMSADALWLNKTPKINLKKINLTGANLTIDAIASVAKFNRPVQIVKTKKLLKKMQLSSQYVIDAVASGKNIYGVTTSFGSLSHIRIQKKDTKALQKGLFAFLKAGAGEPIAVAHVRAGMMLRVNSLLQGASGIRIKIPERLIQFLNLGITPKVLEFGSIGASGDLVPLGSIGGALIGLSSAYKVFYQNKEISALTVLNKLKLPKIELLPKEALAILNGTSVLTGIASNCIYDAKLLLHLTLNVHALLMQAIGVSVQPFDLFIHTAKPHVGQYWIARQMQSLIKSSKLVHYEDEHRKGRLGLPVQDRYSFRCLAQYLGPVADALEIIAKQIEVESNSVTDNPLIDTKRQISLHGGNFLGEYPSIGMDQLRYHLNLLAKHLDVQIGNVVAPAFNNGLPHSLIGNTAQPINCGFKGLQICANSISPLLAFMSQPIAPLYPTYAEEFNQNISSQGYVSSLLTSRSIEIYQQFAAIALMFGIQAVSLRTFKDSGHYDPRKYLSHKSRDVYETFFKIVGKKITAKRPYVWNDDEQNLDEHIAIVAADIKSYAAIPQCIFSHLKK